MSCSSTRVSMPFASLRAAKSITAVCEKPCGVEGPNSLQELFGYELAWTRASRSELQARRESGLCKAAFGILMKEQSRVRSRSSGPRATLPESAMSLARVLLVAALAVCPSLVLAQGKGGIDKLYVIDCGQGHSTDMSRWSPGENVGVGLDVSDNCYLIHHTSGRYLLWDTGITDAVVGKPEGSKPSAPGAPVWQKAKTIVATLAELGVKPDDVTYVAVSHTHPDHIGNVEAFPKSMLLVQKAEYEWPLPLGVGRFKPGHPVTKLEGDHDVFGDGSALILSTPAASI